ncbi:hydrogenase maturation nickel metallochaperone HypA [Sideroxydans sp. CL21]|jgi:hydrogenase nickel incorporation protein HypA/HybF|uniref:hydrogenase maturation nickel metallochaperone HypA n=1 Tax=Sideroxydans sp. CL21 TaxID=2600596 RepID=UPI0024BCDF10|nr:hydrogenase maturation nickel metallochaperone HypA [Sideroxydans sp. CL21]
MHEMSLAEGVLQLIEDSAKTQSFSRVKTVWLEIGQLAGVEVEAMKFCFEAVVNDSIAQGAQLVVIEIPGQAWCLHCAEVVNVRVLYDACPKCGSHQVQVTGGNEMRVKELEVE